LRQDAPVTGKRVDRLLRMPRRTLISILIGNMFVNIMASAKCEQYLHIHFPRYSIVISLAVVTPLILVFGEIAPKIIAFRLNKNLAPFISFMVSVLYYLFIPFQVIVYALSNPFISFFSSLSRDTTLKYTSNYNDEELNAAVAIGTSRNIFDDFEQNLIVNMARFRSVTARHILTPRTRIFSLDIKSDPDKLREDCIESAFARIPIYEDNKENIIGVLLKKDMFKEEDIFAGETTLRSYLRPARFVPETIRADKLFGMMMQRKMHIHFIVDEYGGLEGIVTLDDLIADIFGTSYDDKHEDDNISKLPGDPFRFKATGLTPLDECNRVLPEPIEDDNAVTLAGYLANQLGTIPHPGNSLEQGNYRFKVKPGSGDDDDVIVQIKWLAPDANQENHS